MIVKIYERKKNMKLLQVAFSMLLSCLIGGNSPEALALVIIGAFIPNIDSTDRYFSNCISVKGPAHSLLFAAIFFIISFFLPAFFYVGIGVLGHIVVELFSYETQLEVLWPIKLKIHFPMFHQKRNTMNFLAVLIFVLMFVFFIDIKTIVDICVVYIDMLKYFTYWVIDVAKYVYSRVASVF